MLFPIFILSISLTFANADIIESIFDICDQKDTGPGLTLAEVQESTCMDYLKTTFGILSENIGNDFASIDQNGDGIVSKEEIFYGCQRLGRDRSPGFDITIPKFVFPWVVVESIDYTESQMEEILLEATQLRDNYLDPSNEKLVDFVYDLNLFLKNSYGQKATCFMGKLGDVSARSFYRDFLFVLHDDKFWVRCSGMYSPDSISMSLVNVPWEVVNSMNYTESQLDEILLKVTNLRDTHLVPFEREKLHDLTNGLTKFLRNSYGQKASCVMDKLEYVNAMTVNIDFYFELVDNKFWVRCWGKYLLDCTSEAK